MLIILAALAVASFGTVPPGLNHPLAAVPAVSGMTVVKDGCLSHVFGGQVGQGDRVGVTSAGSCSSPCRWSGGGARHAERVSSRPLREIVLSLVPYCGPAGLACVMT